jgi:hypothetical protein
MDGNMQQNKIYGTKEIITLITKIFGIIGMIFIGISLALPWASYTIPYTTYSLSMNTWGVSTNIPMEIVGEAGYKFISDPFYINAFQSGITEGIVAGIFMILVFAFAIITLLLSLNAFRSIGTGVVNKSFLKAGIFSIVTIVLCAIGVMQGSSYGNAIYFNLTGTTIAGGFGFTWAFILTIIAMVFFFINYGIDVFMLQSGIGMQKTLPYQQPQVMYASQQQPPIQQTPPIEQPEQQTPSSQQSPIQQTPPPHKIPPPEQTTPQQQIQQEPQVNVGSCPKCGAQLQANSKFCQSCGTQI